MCPRMYAGFDISVKVVENEKEWKVWCDSETPEEEKMPCGYGDILGIEVVHAHIFKTFYHPVYVKST